MSEPTQEELKELLAYDPLTGLFTWIVKRPNATVGGTAGNLDPSGYIRISVKGKNYTAHRLAFLYMTGEFPPAHTDHINHKRADNRWANLRAISQLDNNRNTPLRSDNTSGMTGVSFNLRGMNWVARIKVGATYKFLGGFASFEEAKAARLKANKLYDFHPNHGK